VFSRQPTETLGTPALFSKPALTTSFSHRISAGMITLFHVFQMLGLLVGAMIGARLGFSVFGITGACILAPLLAYFGFRLGNLPWIWVLRSEKKKFQKESTKDLIDGLRGKYAFCPNIVLAELRIRGEDITAFLPYLQDLMVSPDVYTRNRGWVALKSALPEYALLIPSYLPTLELSQCQEIVKTLK
jgi:hypothetical protein